MSIENEKWTWDDEENGIIDQDGEWVRIDDLYGPAIAELPNALALIERVLRKNAFDRLEDDEARSILRRAGVIK